jgi:hypothetical protein
MKALIGESSVALSSSRCATSPARVRSKGSAGTRLRRADDGPSPRFTATRSRRGGDVESVSDTRCLSRAQSSSSGRDRCTHASHTDVHERPHDAKRRHEADGTRSDLPRSRLRSSMRVSRARASTTPTIRLVGPGLDAEDVNRRAFASSAPPRHAGFAASLGFGTITATASTVVVLGAVPTLVRAVPRRERRTPATPEP